MRLAGATRELTHSDVADAHVDQLLLRRAVLGPRNADLDTAADQLDARATLLEQRERELLDDQVAEDRQVRHLGASEESIASHRIATQRDVAFGQSA